MRTERSERKKRRGLNMKKNRWDQIWFIICAPNLIRIAICAGRLPCANIMAQGWSHRYLICGQNRSASQCCSRTCPGFLQHSGIWGPADETVLNKVVKNPKNPPLKIKETHQTIRSASPNFKVIACSCCGYKRKQDISLKNCMLKLKINLDRHGPRPLSNIWLLPDLHCFSFPPTFNRQVQQTSSKFRQCPEEVMLPK